MINWSRIEKLKYARNLEDLTVQVEEYASEVGFDNFGFAAKFPSMLHKKDGFFARHNFSSLLSETYSNLRNPEYVKTDARAQVSVNKLPAGAWRVDGDTSYSNLFERYLPTMRPQLQQAAEFGVQSGITLPLSIQNMEWGFLTFSLQSNNSIKDLEAQLLEVMYFTSFASAVCEQIAGQKSKKHGLTSRELEILKWAALGKTSWEISCIFNLAERTVNFHLANIARKLNVTGRRAACSVAVARGLISL